MILAINWHIKTAFAYSFLALTLSINGIFIFLKETKNLDKILLKKENLLVCWEYDFDTWWKYCLAPKSNLKIMLALLFLFLIIINYINYIINPPKNIAVLNLTLLIILLTFIIIILIYFKYGQDKYISEKEAYITPFGVYYTNGDYTAFDFKFLNSKNKIEKVALQVGTPSFLIFKGEKNNVKLAVPEGEERTTDKIVAYFKNQPIPSD
ncbi:MAG: hypothetical protein HYU63_04330 [Armatimonadetes bacterium]|nr:hypothetical protein [Armatimonadota bacterium]